MRRRRFLSLGSVSIGLASGCLTSTGPNAEPTPSNPDSSESEQSDDDTIYVSPDGARGNAGTEDDPLGTIQHGLEHARPGQTVYVMPGRYFESPRTVRPGTASEPITITGPADAVVSGYQEDDYPDGLVIQHSHIHLTGLTFDGLQDPQNSEDPMSYMLRGITCIPESPTYSTDLIIKPHAVGNVRGSMIDLNYVENVEVGEFRVIGPSGLGYILTDERGHWGEIVYVGQAPGTQLNAVEITGDLEGLDTSNDIHIHHIDNSDGYGHSEIVNTKLGTHDVLVEYCTDGGGSQNNDNYPPASVALQSYGATVRWCDLRDGTGRGISIGSWNAVARQEEKSPEDLTEAERKGGTDNAVYGNRITGFPHGPFAFDNADDGQTADAQRFMCNNEYDDQVEWELDGPCPESIPTADRIGYLGGESPWQ